MNETVCSGGGGRCEQCGAPIINRRQICGVFRPGLGDIVASGLSAVGITKERAAAVAKLVGIEDCGCSKRQQQLNELGHRIGIGSLPQPPSA
jgi:hypothetical protein